MGRRNHLGAPLKRSLGPVPMSTTSPSWSCPVPRGSPTLPRAQDPMSLPRAIRPCRNATAPHGPAGPGPPTGSCPSPALAGPQGGAWSLRLLQWFPAALLVAGGGTCPGCQALSWAPQGPTAPLHHGSAGGCQSGCMHQASCALLISKFVSPGVTVPNTISAVSHLLVSLAAHQAHWHNLINFWGAFHMNLWVSLQTWRAEVSQSSTLSLLCPKRAHVSLWVEEQTRCPLKRSSPREVLSIAVCLSRLDNFSKQTRLCKY